MLAVAVLGFADASYLTLEHFLGAIPPCSLVGGCEKVLTSSYSTVLGVPVSLLGALYYLAVCIGCLIFLESRHLSKNVQAHHFAILKWTLAVTIVGFLASAWFFYIQAFVIHSFCEYCLGSAATSTILFIVAIFMLRHGLERDVPESLG
ncbi:MAG: vitamin K epoxide reductase family protein [Patescibacteria group bacterium]|nr:vitamin K epoxide reductase family protein [Patescibacteria group bacterium]